ncbi:hypothetical protein JOD82_002007 [Paenibacillus sp. 1182]|uniref:hypothetical protein n=1 Tax=Paenibacillus sp. 1182 TaxID=2806565 RepID=UPI001AE8883E|nr:hypothetical protein [Paenibacillus sp. 1182]MBP1308987.1 hypothetical protein [Paenibacillus sp. 1182]
MRLTLYVKYENIQDYLNGKEIKAAPAESKSVIFNHSDLVVEVSIPAQYVLGEGIFESKSMVRGSFHYFVIQDPNAKEGRF